MSDTISANGVSRYIAADAKRYSHKPEIGTPPLAQEFIGTPSVVVDVYPSGRVNFFVQQEVKLLARKVVLNDIYRVKVPKLGSPTVKHYPKPVGLTNSAGPGAPILWRADKDIPERVRDILSSVADDLVANAKIGQDNAIKAALQKLGIEPRSAKVEKSAATATR
jgi:hypothetical protein